jgi:hypothetical protein
MAEQVPFVGRCDDCQRTVRRVMPPTSQFIEAPHARLFCRECGDIVLAEKNSP